MKYMPLAIFAAVSLMLALALLGTKSTPDSPLIGKQLPEISLPRLHNGELQNIHAIAGKTPTIIHFFASWCAPCVPDHDTMMQLKNKYNAPVIIGVAWKNKPEDALAWLAKFGNPYDAVLLDESGASTVPFGLSGVPETFVVGADGTIVFHTASPLSPDQIQQIVLEVK